MGVAKLGDNVRIHYVGRLEDGTVFDSSQDRDPLEFVVGTDELIKGVSLGVVGMSEGEKKVLTVDPEDGYGKVQPDLISPVPVSALPEDLAPQVGMILKAKNSSGRQVIIKVVEVKEDSIVVHANHPLAGKTLVFEIEMLSIAE